MNFMMNFNPPTLPTFKGWPLCIAIDSLFGYSYGKIAQVNPVLMTAIFATQTVAHTVFYQVANFVLGGKDLLSHKIFIATSVSINLIFIAVLRQLELVGQPFACLLSLAGIGQLINRVSYIQAQENLQIDDT